MPRDKVERLGGRDENGLNKTHKRDGSGCAVRVQARSKVVGREWRREGGSGAERGSGGGSK